MRPHPFRKHSWILALLLGGCFSHCGSCATSVIAHGKPVNLLNTAEILELCESLDKRQTPDQLCTAVAAQRTTDSGHCAIIQAECVQHWPPKESCYGESFAAALSSCDEEITLGLFKRCFEQQIDDANRLSCLEPTGRHLIPPPCLSVIAEHCPDMIPE